MKYNKREYEVVVGEVVVGGGSLFVDCLVVSVPVVAGGGVVCGVRPWHLHNALPQLAAQLTSTPYYHGNMVSSIITWLL